MYLLLYCWTRLLLLPLGLLIVFLWEYLWNIFDILFACVVCLFVCLGLSLLLRRHWLAQLAYNLCPPSASQGLTYRCGTHARGDSTSTSLEFIPRSDIYGWYMLIYNWSLSFNASQFSLPVPITCASVSSSLGETEGGPSYKEEQGDWLVWLSASRSARLLWQFQGRIYYWVWFV